MEAQSDSGAVAQVGDAEFKFFRHLIHARTGIALTSSKRSLVAGRLGRRLRSLGLDSFASYRRFLETSDPSGAELTRLINCITTNKTSFFREESHFGVLEAHIRSAESDGRRTYRIWSAACSTGEEPYSLAMTALTARRAIEVRILASDLDTEVLAWAQEGLYPADSVAHVDERLKRRSFLRGRRDSESWVQVKPEVREMITFRHINLIEEPWPIRAGFDAIFCRNVIIYFDRETQQRLFQRMTRYLTAGGLLFVGHAETLFWLDELLVPIEHSVYRARN